MCIQEISDALHAEPVPVCAGRDPCVSLEERPEKGDILITDGRDAGMHRSWRFRTLKEQAFACAVIKLDLPGSGLALLFCQARLHHLLHKSCRQRLVLRKADRAFGCLEALQFILEHSDHGLTRREQTAML